MRRQFGLISAGATLALLVPATGHAAETPVPTTTAPSTSATTTATPSTTTSASAPAPSTTTSSTTMTTQAPTTSTTAPVPTTTTSTPQPLAPAATTTTSTATTAPTTTAPTTTSTTSALVAGGTSSLIQPTVDGPTTSTDPVEVAAGFLARQLAANGGYLTQYGYPDLGLTIDAILAMDAAGVGASQANASTQYVADHINEYIGPAWGDTELYAGALGKAIVLAEAHGADPRNFGGVNLVESLLSLEGDDGGFHDRSQYGDNANTIGMTFDLIGLKRAGVNPTTANVSWLLTHQCANGGFAVSVADGACTSDTDATAYAIQALLAVQGPSSATGKALNFLAEQQDADGGLASAVAGPNTNSTGLAGQAFLEGARLDPASAAADFVLDFELNCLYAAPLRGAIAYDDADLEAAAASTAPSDVMVRATTQGLLALAGVSLMDVTVQGAVANAPTVVCAAASTTPSATTTKPVSAPTAAAPRGGELALTGAEAGSLGLVGGGLIVSGAALVLVSRRRGRHA